MALVWTASTPVMQIVNWREKLTHTVNFLLQNYDVVYGDDSTCYICGIRIHV